MRGQGMTGVRYITAIFFVVAMTPMVSAQEFWAMPDRFAYSPGDTMRVRFYVGNNFAGEPWNVALDRIKTVKLISSAGTEDLTARIKEGRGIHLTVPLARPGRYSLSVETENAFAEIQAEKFNDFLKEYAMDNVISHRKKTNTTTEPGTEIYRRHSWFSVVVGEVEEAKTAAPEWPVQIIPLSDPLAIHKGAIVRFKVLFRDKPLFGARAFVWNNKQGKTYMQPVYTQQDGSLDVRVFSDGEWMVSVVKMTEADDVKADWQSYWASIVFQVPE